MSGARRTSQNRLKPPSEIISDAATPVDDLPGSTTPDSIMNAPGTSSSSNSGTVADCIDMIVAIGDDRADEYMFEFLEKVDAKTNGIFPVQQLHHQNSHSSSRAASSGPVRSSPFSSSIDAESAMERARDHDLHSRPLAIESPLPVSAYFPVQLQYSGAPGASFPSSPTASPIASTSASPEHGASMGGGGVTPSSTTVLKKRSVLTCTVGSKSSAARWFLPSANEVVLYLGHLINGTVPLTSATSSILSPLQSPVIMARSSSSHPMF